MTRKSHDTLLIPYAYGINTPNLPLRYGIDTVSIHKRLETRDKDTSDGIKSTDRMPKGVFAFEDGQGSKPNFKQSRSRKPKASKILWRQMSAILDAVSVPLSWVGGHSGIPGYEAADPLACDALKRGLQERRAA